MLPPDPPPAALRTERLVLRRWCERDRPAVRALTADPLVMATLGPPMTAEQSDTVLDRWDAGFDADPERPGLGLYAVVLDGECLGFTGLSRPWFRDGVEIGWRLRSEHWGRGYAPEAARALLALAFTPLHEGGLGLDEVLSFTAASNHKSRRVMEKIGLRYVADGDFDHPSVPEGDPLRPHVLYRLRAEEYRTTPVAHPPRGDE
jgi:RimJ/RimL family protein N-acetyltransferase